MLGIISLFKLFKPKSTRLLISGATSSVMSEEFLTYSGVMSALFKLCDCNYFIVLNISGFIFTLWGPTIIIYLQFLIMTNYYDMEKLSPEIVEFHKPKNLEWLNMYLKLFKQFTYKYRVSTASTLPIFFL